MARPHVGFHCNIDFDPFLYMEDHKKVYGMDSHPSYLPALIPPSSSGFTITMYEFRSTIQTLWQTTKGI